MRSFFFFRVSILSLHHLYNRKRMCSLFDKHLDWKAETLRLFPSFYFKQSFGSPSHPRMLSAAENLNFSLSQWRRRPPTSRQASRGSRVGVQFSPIAILLQGIVDFDNKSVTLRWNKPTDTGGRPITHFIIQVGQHRQLIDTFNRYRSVWNNSQPNFFCRRRTSSEVGSTR